MLSKVLQLFLMWHLERHCALDVTDRRLLGCWRSRPELKDRFWADDIFRVASDGFPGSPSATVRTQPKPITSVPGVWADRASVPGFHRLLLSVPPAPLFELCSSTHAGRGAGTRSLWKPIRTVMGHKSPVGSDFPPKLNFFAAYLYNKNY